MYHIKEIYYTLQGEGYHAGRPALFCRFTGCNLWSGREEDRHKAICQFCDTDFVGTNGPLGGKYHVDKLCQTLLKLWNHKGETRPFVVFTGGEPALQLDKTLVDRLHEENFEIAIETNGTLALPSDIDWICVSPKAGSNTILKSGNELKLVYPQENYLPEKFEHLDFQHFYLQPMNGIEAEENTIKTINYCKSNPKWKLSLQLHKILDIP